MEKDEDLKKKTVSGLFWRFAERCGAQGVSFIVAIVLARLLEPDDYGMIAMVTVFITISQVFVDSGMGSALIQKKNADDLDFSSVFYFNIALCLMIYLVLFLISPLIAKFYGKPLLTDVLRILGLTVIISSVKNVQQAYVTKKMLFKRFFFATLGGTVAAAVVGIGMAYMGFGVWALVVQQLLNAASDTLILWITVKWRPLFRFSLERVRKLFTYGWKLLLSALIDTTYNNIRQLIIGKIYSSQDLAYYNRGRQIPNLIVTNINTSIDSVLLPVLSEEQDDAERVKSMTRRAIKTSCYIMCPLMAGLAVVSEPLTRLLLTEKWMTSVPFLRIFCVIFVFQPIQTANLNAIKAMGRSDLFLKLEIIKKSIGMIILLIAMRYGVFVIAASLLLYSLIAQILNSYPNKKLLNYGYSEQIRDILPYICLGCVMAAAIYPVLLSGMPDALVLLIQIAAGALIYIIGSLLLKMDSFHYILNILKRIFLVAMVCTLTLAGIDGGRVHAKNIRFKRNHYTLRKGIVKKLPLTNKNISRRRYFVWRSSNRKVVRVNKKGVITCRKKGTAVITAIVLGQKKKIRCRITVKSSVMRLHEKLDKKILVSKISVKEPYISVMQGDSFLLKPEISPPNADNSKLIYHSGKDQIARVTSGGKVYGVSPGITEIQISSTDGSDVAICVKVRVLDLKNVLAERFQNFMAVQGMCCNGENIFYSIVDNFNCGRQTIIKKMDLYTKETESVQNYSYGHANGLAYDTVNDTIQCTELDDNGNVYVIRADTLAYERKISLYDQLKDVVPDYIGISAVAYDEQNNNYIYSLRGERRGFVTCDRDFHVKRIVYIDSPGYTAQGICVQEGRIYMAWWDSANNKNYIISYNMDGRAIEKADVSFGHEIEGICINGNTVYMLFNNSDYKSYVIKSCSMEALFENM